ncbi:MAG: glycosyltransferase family 39 protein [Candidatus Melainabacteria bacterium]|nr:MAG: glycosyltransferase family 39 protein [Candidatus Melainabacteria bacterium]
MTRFYPLLVFVVALVIGIIVGLSRRAIDSAYFFDSGLYMQSAVAIHEAIGHVSSVGLNALQPECIKLKEKLLLDGPVLPLIGGIPFWVMGAKPKLEAMQPVLALLVLFHSLSSLLMFYLGKKLTKSDKFGLVSGLLWATYPAAVIGTTKLLTEPVGVLLSLLALTLCVRLGKEESRKRVCLTSFALGVIMSLFVLLRPILAPAMVPLLIGLVFFKKKRGMASSTIIGGITACVFGASLTLTPWLWFTSSASGEIVLTPKRAPVYNLICGFDLPSDGRIFVTPRPASIDEEKEKSMQMLSSNIQQKPLEHLLLILRKPSRIWQDAWNDYRTPYLFLPASAITWWHAALIASGIAGLISFLTYLSKKESFAHQEQPIILFGSLCFISIHFLYVFFSACPRYGHTSMPFFTLFAVYFLSRLMAGESKLKRSALFVAGILITFLLILNMPIQSILLDLNVASNLALLSSVLLKSTFLLLFSAIAILTTHTEWKPLSKSKLFKMSVPVFAMTVILVSSAEEIGAPTESKAIIAPNQKTQREIELNVDKPDWALVLIDGSKELEQANVIVNGHKLDGSLIPLHRFSTSDNSLHNYQMFAKLLNIDESQFRQWRALTVPIQDLNFNGKNEVVLQSQNDGTTLYSSYKQLSGETRLPSLFNFCFYKLNTNATDLDARVPYVEINNHDKKAPSLKRIIVALGNKNKNYNVALDAPLSVEEDLLKGKSKPFVIPQGMLTFVDTGINDLSINCNGLLKVTLEAKVQSPSPTKVKVDLMCRLENQPDFSVNVFDDTKVLDLKGISNFESFQFVSYVPASCVSAGKFRPQAVFVSKNAPVQLNELKVKIERIDAPDFRSSDINLY